MYLLNKISLDATSDLIDCHVIIIGVQHIVYCSTYITITVTPNFLQETRHFVYGPYCCHCDQKYKPGKELESPSFLTVDEYLFTRYRKPRQS